MGHWIVGSLTSIYVFMVIWFTVGVLRASSRRGKARPSVTVVVPLHNEEQFLAATLDALACQDYEGEWEVVCVDDRSTDATPRLLAEFCANHSRFRCLSVPMDSPPLASPKKRALETGFTLSHHEILMTMDADCIPPPGWLASMASRFEPGVGIVQGPKRNWGRQIPVHAYQKLETLGFTLIEAAGFSLGKPILASAAALAYRRELFYRVGGFSDLMGLTSGDDDMLVHKMARQDVSFCYNMDPDAQVATAPVDSWKALLNQRARWSSNGTSYEDKKYTLFLSLIYTFLCWLLLSPFLVLLDVVPWQWAVWPWLAKAGSDFIFLSAGAFRLRSLPLLLWFPMVVLVQVPLITLAVPMGLLRLFRWR